MENLFYFILTFLIANVKVTTQNQLQSVEFYATNSCNDLTGSKNGTDLSLGTQPGYFNARAIRLNGLWELITQVSQNQYTSERGRFIGKCSARKPLTSSYSEIVRFGPVVLGQSEITIYTESNFQGLQFSSIDAVSLPRPIIARSWHFSGLEEWTIYTDINYGGNLSCLAPGEDVVQSRYGVTWEFDTKLVVGSARRGCYVGSPTPSMPSTTPAIITTPDTSSSVTLPTSTDEARETTPNSVSKIRVNVCILFLVLIIGLVIFV